ncbi:MAG: protein TolR [Gammaproteobacteria bacterium]|nr:protein TolR [Gammaproteobacteria bacterium]
MRRRLVNEINVVPYIDVMLVLLVIFMITAPLLTQGIRVDLPRLAAEPLPQEMIRDNRPLVVTVDAQGRMYMNIGEDPEEPLDSPVVVARTAAVLTRKPETPVLVRASERLPYGDVVAVMGLLTRAGAGKVGLVTRPLPMEEE